MRETIAKALTWALKLQPDPAVLKWLAAVLAAAFFGLLLFAIFQYQTSERSWAMKLVLGLLAGATVIGLGAAVHWLFGVFYGVGGLLTWLVWVLTRRCSWSRRAWVRGLTAGLTLGPWLWLGATEKSYVNESAWRAAEWLLAPRGVIWLWMLLGALWLLVLVGGWGCWRWPGLRPGRRRWLVASWAVLGLLGLNWYAAGRVDLFTACKKGQHWRLGYVLLSRPGSQWYRNMHDQTPLHRAASNEHTATIRLLLAAGADVEAKDHDGQTALTPQLALLGDIEVVRVLVAAGTRLGQCSPGWVLGEVWDKSDALERLRLLLATGLPANGKSDDGWSALHQLTNCGSPEMVKLLIAAGADADARNNEAVTPLHLAAHFGAGDKIRILLAAGAKVNERNEKGETPLDLTEDDECRKLLRAAGGKTGEELDAEKQAPK